MTASGSARECALNFKSTLFIICPFAPIECFHASIYGHCERVKVANARLFWFFFCVCWFCVGLLLVKLVWSAFQQYWHSNLIRCESTNERVHRRKWKSKFEHNENEWQKCVAKVHRALGVCVSVCCLFIVFSLRSVCRS